MNARRIYLSVLSISLILLFINIYYHLKSNFEEINLENHTIKNTITVFDKSPTFMELGNQSSLNILILKPMTHNFQSGFLKVNSKNMKIFVHGSYDMISNSLLKYNTWESIWLYQLTRYFKKYPEMMLLDIGCNLGVYTLTAAYMGNKVIAIDANRNNTDRLVQTIIVNNLSTITVILNAVSNVRKEFSMRRNNANIGSQSIEDNQGDAYRVKSIFLDDLLVLLNGNEELMLKIDIEQHEVYAIKKASKLFDRKNIRLVLMEWEYVKRHKYRDDLMEFFLKRNYHPYMEFFTESPLILSQNMSWPGDIVWKRK